MKKKIINRCLMGAPLGVCITVFISIVISLIQNDGVFYAVGPELISDCGTELNAVLVQTACAMLYGVLWGGASVVWEAESWSLLRQTATHLAVCCPATLAIAWLLRWMPRAAMGIVLYLAIFFGIYLVIWLSQYMAIKKRVRQMNRRLDTFRKQQ